MVELTAKRRFQTYSSFWKRTELTEAEKLLCGTFWDEYICTTLGAIAHFDSSKGHNRWSTNPHHVTVVALWANLDAMTTDNFVELV